MCIRDRKDALLAVGNFSAHFEQPSADTFHFEGYDNAAGLSRYYAAIWNGVAFHISERTLSPDEFVNAAAQSFSISKEGAAQFTIPIQMPDGLSLIHI